MRKTLLAAAALVLFSLTAMAQSTDTKGAATTGPAAQSGDNMSKGHTSKDKTSKKKMSVAARRAPGALFRLGGGTKGYSDCLA
jgi:hypothetical protein